MAALQCEICGGKLMAKAGGLFECEYCGMQYDKLRIQEMVQEIKGIVKVEGTVQVQGTVSVDNSANKENLLKRIAICAEDGRFDKVKEMTEELLNQYLDSAGVPDPELVIRPSGEQRTSNFLPWQTVYSEFVFMDVLWPDFGPEDLDAAIGEYQRRNRRFGGA